MQTTPMDEQLTTGGEEDDVRANGTDRHAGNPITPPVQDETVARLAPEGTHAHQGQSRRAHQQAG
jgi:hypothetical protein